MIKRLALRMTIPILALAFFLLQTQPAFACGGLIAPDGDVRLERASTLIAWHNGIEHYLTSFAYQGKESNVGLLVPFQKGRRSGVLVPFQTDRRGKKHLTSFSVLL